MNPFPARFFKRALRYASQLNILKITLSVLPLLENNQRWGGVTRRRSLVITYRLKEHLQRCIDTSSVHKYIQNEYSVLIKHKLTHTHKKKLTSIRKESIFHLVRDHCVFCQWRKPVFISINFHTPT